MPRRRFPRNAAARMGPDMRREAMDRVITLEKRSNARLEELSVALRTKKEALAKIRARGASVVGEYYRDLEGEIIHLENQIADQTEHLARLQKRKPHFK